MRISDWSSDVCSSDLNATGVAGIIEIAGKFARTTPAPKRSLAFIAVTLEESGLLGSQYYVAHPAFPLDKTVGVINIDAIGVYGKARRSEEHTSELQSLMRISYAVFCLKKKKTTQHKPK